MIISEARVGKYRTIESRILPTVLGDKAYISGLELERDKIYVSKLGPWYTIEVRE